MIQTNLTSSQRDELIDQYVDLHVDSMDFNDLIQFVSITLKEDYHNLSDEELKCEIECTHDEELYEELVDNVTSEKCTTYEELISSNTKDYSKQVNSFGN